jgi:hypothetical protein
MSDTRQKVIDTAKCLAKQGRHFRFFDIDGQIWECYRAEYLPSLGERAWLAEPIKKFIIHNAGS